MFKQLALSALCVATVASPAAAATTFNLGGTVATGTGFNYAVGVETLAVTALTYTVAPGALNSLAQLTAGATITRAPTGLGVATPGENGGETPQVDTNGTKNEILHLSLGKVSKLVSATFNYVDENDTLRIYGEKGGVLTYLGFPGEFWDNTANDAPMSGGATVIGHTGSGGINNNWTFTVNFSNALAAFDSFYFTSNNDAADGYRLESVSVDAVPEPGTWAMMLTGFGFAGFALRRRREMRPQAI